MKNLIKISTAVLLIFILSAQRLVAWGPEGHAMVGRIAMKFLKPDVRENVLKLLGNMSVDTAANWMDIMKSNQEYEFMRSWHYLDFPKDQPYQATNQDNIVNRLILTDNELKHKSILCEEQVRFDLLVLMHLMGDLHMPLHTGYDDDLGGNKVMVQYDTMKTHNLHRFWDEDIIRLTNITVEDCLLTLKNNEADSQIVDYVKWMKESRSLLGQVYDYPGFTITEGYLKKNKAVVERQLLLAGLRLATILNRLFYSPAPVINTQLLAPEYKNGIDIKDAMKNLGKTVTICSRVFGIRTTDKITQIFMGDKSPDVLFTIVIFASSYPKFQTHPVENYKDKNICVKGKVQEYRGKPQIIVESPEDIIIK